LLIFGPALRFVGSGYGLHCGQPAISGSEHIAAAASTSRDLSSIGFPF
jgi:hypothetical protein